MTNFQYKTFSEKPKQDTLFGDSESSKIITLREEQREAIDLAKKHFYKHKTKDGTPKSCKFLWNAKMRFGKTICALQLAREMGVKRILIVTHRPVVDEQWFEAFQETFGNGITGNEDIISKYKYGRRSEKNKEQDKDTAKYRGSFSELEKFVKKEDNHYIFFVSMQYLCLSELVNEKTRIKNQTKKRTDASKENEKLKADILYNDWDLVVIDEAHEGTRTDLGLCVIDKFLKKDKTKMLHLSGTPFNLYEDFDDKEIYTWDYVSEQRAKKEWDIKHPGEPNPYAEMPELNIFAFNIAKDFEKFIGEDGVFTFSEFFRIWENKTAEGEDVPAERKGRFVHEDDVKRFIEALRTTNSENNFPFSTQEFRDQFRHTLWVVSRVSEANALKALLEKDEKFKRPYFKIINVAGDEEKEDALERVNREISEKPEMTRTITISCGRLTTGVTVKPWTAVLYLKGGDTASTYMQTIFRAQSHYTATDGKVKSQCYVFDFAPDRALKIVAETAKFSSMAKEKEKKAQEKDEDKTQEKIDKETLEEFIKFCPIYINGQMTKFDVNTIYQKLESAYIDRLVQRGFDDPCLYNQDELNKIDPSIIDYIANNGGVAPKNKNENTTLVVDINHMTEEQRKAWNEKVRQQMAQAQKNAEKKAKKDKAFQDKLNAMTPAQREEWERQEAERLALKEKAKKDHDEFTKRIKNIRGIARRIPLLMYGGSDVGDAEGALTVDNFTAMISDESWKEFMPKGIKKEDFNKIKKCFNATRFEEAGKRYRAITREADTMHVEERIARITEIFSYLHNPDKETVLTPWPVVNEHMGMTLGGYNFYDDEGKQILDPEYIDNGDITKELFDSVDKNGEIPTKILEINSKTGLYPLYVTYSLYHRRLKEYIKAECIEEKNLSVREEQVVWDDIIAENIYVICNTPMAVGITKRTLCGFREDSARKAHIKNDQLIEKAKNNQQALVDEIKSEGFWKNNNSKNMIKFSAVVGNPPYMIENDSNRKEPIYHLFYDVAFDVAEKVTLITPGRFLFNVGQTPKQWMKKMINDEHLKLVRYFIKSKDVFENINIPGGIAITLRDANKNFDAIRFVAGYEMLSNILQKICSRKDFIKGAFSKIVSSQGIYKFTNSLFEDFPQVKHVQGKGTGKKITSKAFGLLSEVFLTKKPNDGENYIQITGLINGQRNTKWIKQKYVCSIDTMNSYKVFVPQANGTGAIGETIPTPIIGEPIIAGPMIGHTDTFLSIGKFESEEEAEACLKYIKTKFMRTMLGTLKVTQNGPSSAYANVPLQDFTSASDIDWTQSVADVDQQLYKKYGLTEEEQLFIETMIMPMK